jgi:hypothetical protein
MKKILTLVLIITVVIANAGRNFSPVKPPIFGIKIDFSSKAYWDGTKCAPRDKGCCLHLECGPTPEPGHIIGELSYTGQNGLSFTISKRNGLSPDMFNELFKQGKFLLDGDATFEQELLQKLGLKIGFQVASGYYPYTIKDDVIVIVFK